MNLNYAYFDLNWLYLLCKVTLFRAIERISFASLEDSNHFNKGISVLDQILLVKDLASERCFFPPKENKVIIQLFIKERENYSLKSNF